MTLPISFQDRACETGFYGLNLEIAVMQVELVAAQYEQLSFGKAIDAIQKVSARGNLFLQEREPWAAFKKVHTHTFTLQRRDISDFPVVVHAWHWTCHGYIPTCHLRGTPLLLISDSIMGHLSMQCKDVSVQLAW